MFSCIPGYNIQPESLSVNGLTRIGKLAAGHERQSTNPLSLRERAGVRVINLDICHITTVNKVLMSLLKLSPVPKINLTLSNSVCIISDYC